VLRDDRGQEPGEHALRFVAVRIDDPMAFLTAASG